MSEERETGARQRACARWVFGMQTSFYAPNGLPVWPGSVLVGKGLLKSPRDQYNYQHQRDVLQLIKNNHGKNY